MSNEWAQFRHTAQPTEFEEHAERVRGGNSAGLALEALSFFNHMSNPAAPTGRFLDSMADSIYKMSNTEAQALEVTAKLANDQKSVKILADRFGYQPVPQNPHEAAEMLHACLIGDASQGRPGLFEAMNQDNFDSWVKNPIAVVHSYGIIDKLHQDPALVQELAKNMHMPMPPGTDPREFLDVQFLPRLLHLAKTDPQEWERWEMKPERMAQMMAHEEEIVKQISTSPAKFEELVNQLRQPNDQVPAVWDPPEAKATWLKEHHMHLRLFSLGDSDFNDFKSFAGDPMAGITRIFNPPTI